MNFSENLEKIIKNGGIQYKTTISSYVFDCPRCGKKDKLWIYRNKPFFCCFVCRETTNFQGKAEYVLSELYGRSIEDMKIQLYGDKREVFSSFMELDLKDPWGDSEEEIEIELEPEEVSINPEFVGPDNVLFNPGRLYLNGRGILEEHIKEYGIMYHPKWRCVVFPVFVNNSLVGWQERSIVNDFKYTLQGFKKDRVFMFQDRMINSDHTILCEGPIDAIKASLCDGGNVASMGKGVSSFQLDIIKKKGGRLYLALDPDATFEIDNICREMYDYMEIFLMPPPKGRKDLGASTFEEVFEQYKTAQKYCGQIQIFLKGY